MIRTKIPYKKPYDFGALLSFFRMRALDGVEVADDASYSRTVSIFGGQGNLYMGCLHVHDCPQEGTLALEMSDALGPVAVDVSKRIARMFDVDGDPEDVALALAPLRDAIASIDAKGVRVPGCFDPFETACRAVLGQQVSVKAANKLAARIVEAHGDRVDTGVKGLGFSWPRPKDVAQMQDIEGAFGELGVIRARSRVIQQIASMVISGALDFQANDPKDIQRQMEALLQVKGIGPWSANYIAMRTLGHADAFLESDAGVAHAMPDMTPRERLCAVEACRPYRSYAVVAMWHSLA